MNKIKTIIALILLTVVAGCERKSVGDTDAVTTGSSEIRINKANIRTFCYDGILYFGVWHNNAFMPLYLSGAVIDKETMQPKRCEK